MSIYELGLGEESINFGFSPFLFLKIMEFQIIPGKNKKFFILIKDIQTKEEFEMYDTIKDTLSRKEYKPFIQSLNKTIEYSYLFRDYLFPIQFWDDIKNKLKELYNYDATLSNYEQLLNISITENSFNEFINKLKVPDKIKIDDEKYKYQQECAYLALLNKIGRIEIGTSGGKTFITYMYCRYIYENYQYFIDDNTFEERPERKQILIIVPSKLLAKQLIDDFTEYQEFENNKMVIETIYSGSKRIANADIVCGTYQSLCNYDKEYFDDFGYIICDEVHRAKAYSIKSEIYDKITNAEFFFGMSGTYPKYKSLDYLHIVSMFGSLLYKKSVKSLIDDGISTPVKIHIIKIKYLKDNDFSKNLKSNGITGSEKYRIEKEFFQNYNERTNIICKLLKHYKSNALILVDTVEYCTILADYIGEYFSNLDIKKDIRIIHGEVNDREQIIQDMKNTNSDFILIGTYGTMSTGVSIPTIEQLYFVDGGKSDTRIRQSIGRGIRLSPNKEYCDVFDFYDDIPYSSFKNHANERISIFKEQNLDFKITNVSI